MMKYGLIIDNLVTMCSSLESIIEHAFYDATRKKCNVSIATVEMPKREIIDILTTITEADGIIYFENREHYFDEHNAYAKFKAEHRTKEDIEKALFFLAMKDTWTKDDYEYDKELREKLKAFR